MCPVCHVFQSRFLQFVRRELLLNNNLLRVLPNEIGKLFHIHILGLHGNPLSKEILSIYNEPNGTPKLLTFLLDNLAGKCRWTTIAHPPPLILRRTLNHKKLFHSMWCFLAAVIPPPPQRPWIPLARPNRIKPACKRLLQCNLNNPNHITMCHHGWAECLTSLRSAVSAIRALLRWRHTNLSPNSEFIFHFVFLGLGIFTVMCYNVLCDKYATRQMYGYCPSWALSWEYRKKVGAEYIEWDARRTCCLDPDTFAHHRSFHIDFFCLGHLGRNSPLLSRYHKFAGDWDRSIL